MSIHPTLRPGYGSRREPVRAEITGMDRRGKRGALLREVAVLKVAGLVAKKTSPSSLAEFIANLPSDVRRHLRVVGEDGQGMGGDPGSKPLVSVQVWDLVRELRETRYREGLRLK